MDGQRTVLDDDVRPEPGPERLVRDQPATGLGQQHQDLPGLCGNGHPPAVARQPALGRIEDKRTKRVDFGIVSFLYTRFDPILTFS